MLKYRKIIFFFLSFLALSACSSSVRFTENPRAAKEIAMRAEKQVERESGNKFSSNVSHPLPDIYEEDEDVYDSGFASYYGDGFDGRKTASGAIFDKNKLTAAHRTLPFGTKVLVTNMRNGKSVIVVINDRGPFKGGRIIDLSEGAARQLDMIQSGVVPVEIKIIK